MGIDKLRKKIQMHKNEGFYTKTGKHFTYNIEGEAIRPIRLLEYNCKSVNRLIPKKDFAKAISIMPISSLSQLSFAQGASYLYGIITDKRMLEDKYGS